MSARETDEAASFGGGFLLAFAVNLAVAAFAIPIATHWNARGGEEWSVALVVGSAVLTGLVGVGAALDRRRRRWAVGVLIGAVRASPGGCCLHLVLRHPARVLDPAGVTMWFVQVGLVPRAIAAATSLAGALDLKVNDAIVIQNSNTLALRLLPCDVFARTSLVGQEVAAFEVQLARGLAAAGGPVASLDPRVEPRVYERDGFAVTFWTHYWATPDPAEPAEYALALQRLHAAMRSIKVDAPHFTERLAAAEHLLTHRDETPALANDDRVLLLDTLQTAGQTICRHANEDQLLHGEPHPGNLLGTSEGLLFIDFETCCRGPIEFDVAHVPNEVSLRCPGVDQVLLQECRRLVLAMVAALRWDVRDEFPNGRRQATQILGLLRNGPPWPALGAPMSPLGAS